MKRNGDAELDAMIRKIRAIPGLARRAAPDVADAVKAELNKSIAAGTAPDGTPWRRRKADGEKPLADAGEALFVAAVGKRIVCHVRGYIARHTLGRARGGIVRRVLPLKGVPPALAKAITAELTARFNDEMKGGQ